MNKKFEYIDDNPGSYFGMLIESLEDNNYLSREKGDAQYESLTEDSDSNNDYLSKLKKEESELQSKITSIQRQYHYKGYMKDYKYKMASNRLKEVKQLIFKLEAESKNEKVLSKADVTKAIKKISGLETLKTTTSGVRGYRPVTGGSFKVDDGGLNNFIVYFYNNTDKIPEIIDELKKQGFKISYVQKSSFNVENTRSLNSLKNEALTEDKFVPKDKMSKKAQKELNDKKRGTWGNTKPITRVQPNKKAYDRKRDSKVVDERLDSQSDFELTYVLDELKELSNYYKSRQDDWSKRDSEEFLKDINSLLHRTQHLFRKAKVLGESKKLNESSDGWNKDNLYDLKYILDKLENLNYEINNCVRGAYSYCKTYEELGHYISDLGEKLADLGSDVSLIDEEEDDEFED